MNDLVQNMVKFARLHREVERRNLTENLGKLKKTADITEKLTEVRIPAVVDNLISRNIIEPDAKTAMVQQLKDHSKCLLFIDALASTVRPGALGSGLSSPEVEIKRAHFVGEYIPEDYRESGKAFRDVLLSH